MMNIGIILLAAGEGKRFGGNKLTALLKEKPMYLWTLEKLEGLETAIPPVVVTGVPEIISAAEDRGMIAVWNRKPELGISHSIRLGICRVGQLCPEIEGILFMVCDQPWLKKRTLIRMLSEFNGGILAVRNGKNTGNPVIFSHIYMEELSRLTGDTGGRRVLSRHMEDVRFLEVDDSRELQDIDTWEQLKMSERQEEN